MTTLETSNPVTDRPKPIIPITRNRRAYRANRKAKPLIKSNLSPPSCLVMGPTHRRPLRYENKGTLVRPAGPGTAVRVNSKEGHIKVIDFTANDYVPWFQNCSYHWMSYLCFSWISIIVEENPRMRKFWIYTIRNIIWIHSLKKFKIKKVIEFILLDRRKISEHGR